jgi:hypothetical protein
MSMLAKLKRIRKLLYATIGFGVTLAVLIPPEAPGKLNEAAAVVLALGALVGVYKARNAPPPSAEGLLARRVRESNLGGNASPRHPDWPVPSQPGDVPLPHGHDRPSE